MKKKLIPFILLLACVVLCICGLVACNTEPERRVEGLLVAKTGEQPNYSDNHTEITVNYGEKPDLTSYKLYLKYSNGDIDTTPLDLNDEKLTVKYSYNDLNSDATQQLDKLPDDYLAGSYSINYTYDQNTDSGKEAIVYIIVNRATSGNFRIEMVNRSWYEDGIIPAITLKTPKGLPVQYRNSVNDQYKQDDTSGQYDFCFIKKEDYDKFTEEQKTDHKFMEDYMHEDAQDSITNKIWTYSPNLEMHNYCPAGTYMLFAMINATQNYEDVVTTAVEVRVKDSFEDRKVTFKNAVLQDSSYNTITTAANDTETALLEEVKGYNSSNAGKYAVCKKEGKIGGTVNFGGGAFDSLQGEKVYYYERQEFSYSINLYHLVGGEKEYVGDGRLNLDNEDGVNNFTVRIMIQLEVTYYLLITFSL